METIDNEVLKTLEEDIKRVKKLKRDNKDLRKKVKNLLENNRKFAGLVKQLDRKSDAFKNQKMIYDFGKGGMITKNELERHKLDLEKNKVTLKGINTQLQEILQLMEKNK